MRQFILDMSVVDRFSAPLGDYVNGERQSARILRDLQHTNLFLIPLDDEGQWFRFHHLFGAVARSTLETEQPERAAMLHGRAADWLSENGYVDTAIDHAWLPAARSCGISRTGQLDAVLRCRTGNDRARLASGSGLLNRRREHPNPGHSSVDGGILRPTGRIGRLLAQLTP